MIRFIMGHSGDTTKEWNAAVEEKKYGGFLRIDLKVKSV